MGEVVLWLVLLAVAVGLPLFVLRLDRLGAARTTGLQEDEWAFRSRYGLTASDMAQVARPLQTGRPTEESRLRPLAAERARAVLVQQRRHVGSARRRVLLAGDVLCCALTIALAVLVVSRPGHDPVPLVLLMNAPLQFWLARRRRHRLEAAVVSNSAAAGR